MSSFHEWSGEAQRQVGTMVKLFIYQLVEVVHHTLHDFRPAKVEFVLNLRHVQRLQALQILLERVDLQNIELHLEVFKDGSWLKG